VTAPVDPEAPRPEDVAAWSDDELEAEIARRRRARSAGIGTTGTGAGASSWPRRSRPAAPGSFPGLPSAGGVARSGGRMRSLSRRLEQAYANLELSPDATLETVRQRYLELLDRYEPSRFEGERRRLAENLVTRLRDAYDTVRRTVGSADSDRDR